jgi:hypothetical protein
MGTRFLAPLGVVVAVHEEQASTNRLPGPAPRLRTMAQVAASNSE